MWCLGNEMDGPWQTGHKTAEEYGRLAAETARAMRQVDPGLELVACGSSSQSMPTFAAWEATVLRADVRPRRLHLPARLLRGEDGDATPSWPPPWTWSHFIEQRRRHRDHVGARLKSKKRINLSFDEWNVWYQTRLQTDELRAAGLGGGARACWRTATPSPTPWSSARC